VEGIIPSKAPVGSILNDVEITAKNLLDGPSLGAKLEKTGEIDIVGTDVKFVSGQTMTADFDLTGAAVGFRDVVVTNGDGCEGTGPGLFEIYN